LRKLGVAVVGAGFWGRNHVRVFSGLPETELRAVCDVDPERAERVAREFGVEGYTDSRKMLKRKDIEAVSVCTWTTAHAAEATKALREGKHVFVEKPISSTVRQARRIVELAKSENRHLMVGFIERFNPGVQRVKENIDKNEIGSVVSATAIRVSRWPERVGDVGVVKDAAIHDIDIVRYVFSENPIAVYAEVGNLKHARFEDYAQIMLTFKKGKTAFIEANWLTPYKIRRLVVTGSKGILSLDYLTQEVKIDSAYQTKMPRHEWEEPLRLELQHFAKSVLNDEESSVTGIDGLNALIICEAVIQSAEKCKAVRLEQKLEK
jgi:UDP-N-acetylglucosamine 3-dehydrogenase